MRNDSWPARSPDGPVTVSRAGLHQATAGPGKREGAPSVGAMKIVTDASFEADVLKNDKPVLVDYWAEWCGPCKMVAPVLDAIAAEHGDKLEIVKLNVDENPEVTQKYRILNIPTLGVFQNGEVVKELVGARPKSALLRELSEFL